MSSIFKEAIDGLEDICWKQESNQSDTELLKMDQKTLGIKINETKIRPNFFFNLREEIKMAE